MYKELDHINATLRALGELPVNSTDTPHPEVPAIRADLQNRSVALQADGWWFNTEFPTLIPQPNKHILIPNNALSVDARDSTLQVTARGGRLYNTHASTYEFAGPVKVRRVRYVAFDDMPYSARFYLSASALAKTFAGLDGDGRKLEQYRADESRAYTLFHAEHIRNVQANMLDRAPFAVRMRRVVGSGSGNHDLPNWRPYG